MFCDVRSLEKNGEAQSTESSYICLQLHSPQDIEQLLCHLGLRWVGHRHHLTLNISRLLYAVKSGKCYLQK